MAKQAVVAQSSDEAQQVRQVTVTRVVNVPLWKHCADHAANFPEEDALRSTSEFWGAIPGSYCSRCSSLRHKATRGQDTARRQKLAAELKEYRANKAMYDAWLAANPKPAK